jgi:hypothetical protein
MTSETVARGVRRVLSGALTVLLGGTVACSDGPVTPSSPAGQYALAQAAGQPLPGTVFDGIIDDPTGVSPSFHLQFVATSGSITLTNDGLYQHAIDLTATIDGAVQPTTLWRDHGQYTLRGDSVQFVSDFHQNVQFAGSAGTGRLDIEDSLVVRLLGQGPPTQFSFVRQ